MLTSPMIHDWARRLIASEVDANPISAKAEPATIRVYEKLRRHLCTPIGLSGFHALASRALLLAKSQSPTLGSLQVATNGGLVGLGEVEFQLGTEEEAEVGIILISQLLSLFLNLLGEAATTRLIEDVHRQIVVGAELEMNQTRMSVRGTSYLSPFEDILLEADRLRGLSDRLETLADSHDGIDEIMSVAGNIRNIATVLDVFTLIRSKAGDHRDEELVLPVPGYVN